MKMKIGGLTWWRNNYGSILQAYALQTVMNSIEGIDYEIICQYSQRIASLDNFFDKIKNIGLKRTMSRLFWKFGMSNLSRRNKEIQLFIDRYLKISDRQYCEENIVETNKVYDGFLCGSDQIWNTSMVSVFSMYWLGFVENDKLRLAYAPSFGSNSLTNAQKNVIRRNLINYSGISCREDSGTLDINEILGRERCVTVLDPTLIVERAIWDKLSSKRIFNKPYIFAYILRGNRKTRQLIEQFAQVKKLIIVSMPFLDAEKIDLYDFRFGDIKFWNASPADFINAIRYADYIFTDSYHCMIFSCLYHKEFWTFPKADISQINRMKDFLKSFDISGRLINECTGIYEIDATPKINWDKVEALMSERRKKSLNFIYKNLSEWKNK